MKIIENKADIENVPSGCVLTIGNFDGVHKGHQKILSTSKAAAQEKGVELIALTFEPHPLAVLRPDRAPGNLTPLIMKKMLLAELGIDSFVIMKSDEELLSLKASEFVNEFLVKAVKPSLVVEGHDFNFGAGREGSVETLQKIGRECAFEVVVVEPQRVELSNGEKVKVSSSMIRQMLGLGNVSDAAIALGRPYRLAGRIISGRGKGKELGFPTLNMEKPNQILPTDGVYAGTVEIGKSLQQACQSSDKLPAAFSLGTAKTCSGDNPLLIESHLLESDAKKLEGEWLVMDFIEFIRKQREFETEKKLSEQIAKDCEQAKEILTRLL
ncbi:MAG: bifunctional riboflavin kinase/FAD synthetase [Planctomycetota bacterium]|jgi:riboflavin kinase/FMN adenylyltransferase